MTQRSAYRSFSRTLVFLFLAGLAAVAALFAVLSYGDLPTLTQLENPKSVTASEVYAADGSELGRYYVENRVNVRYPDLNPYLIDALVATEDERYYDHSGIDWWGLTRAVGRLGKDGGGSTITQQLSKQMFTGVASRSFPARVVQKLKEWIISTRLERNYTKEEIMAMYFNIFEFNNGAFGVEAASEVYFGKPQSELTREEAAVLVGMFKSPTRYNPSRNPELSRKRREVVLKQMEKSGRISVAEYDSLRQTPLAIAMNKVTHVDGLAPYFRMELRKEVRRLLSDPTIRKPDGSEYDVNRDGLRIYTTIDPAIQRLAEAAAAEHMAELQATYRDRWEGLDPWTYRFNRGLEDETTDAELAYRQRRLRRYVRETDRYARLRAEHLSGVLAKAAQQYDDWEISDRDLDRLLDEDENGGRIEALKRSNSIGTTLEGQYRSLLADRGLWAEVRQARRTLDAAVEKAFDTPTEVTVFAYNEAGEVDTVMSPLDSIKYMRSFLQIGSMAVEPSTGFVKAWVGGVNHKWFPFDHVQNRRQVGSTFKPFIYATAISQQGISPCYRVPDLPITIRQGEGGFQLLQDWAPQNADGEFTGERLTLMDALKQSKNSVSVYLMKQLGDTEPVRGLIHNMGIDSAARNRAGRLVVPNSPAIALGATDLSVEEMTGAYTTWPNNGIYVKPVMVSRIEDGNGKLLYQAIPEERTALDPVSNYTMVRMLQHAGRNYRFGGVETAYGGKTGTTNDYKDGWYMGVTPNLIVGTWVGGDETHIRFRTLRYGQGGYMARPYFVKLLKSLEANAEEVGFEKGAQFDVPRGGGNVDFECDDFLADGEEDGEGPIGTTEDDDDGFGNGSAFGTDPLGSGLPDAGDPFGGGDLPPDPFGDEVEDPFGDEVVRDTIQ